MSGLISTSPCGAGKECNSSIHSRDSVALLTCPRCRTPVSPPIQPSRRGRLQSVVASASIRVTGAGIPAYQSREKSFSNLSYGAIRTPGAPPAPRAERPVFAGRTSAAAAPRFSVSEEQSKRPMRYRNSLLEIEPSEPYINFYDQGDGPSRSLKQAPSAEIGGNGPSNSAGKDPAASPSRNSDRIVPAVSAALLPERAKRYRRRPDGFFHRDRSF